MRKSTPKRRVVVTGIGLISALGNNPDSFWSSLESGETGVRELSSVPPHALDIFVGAEAWDFTGAIDEFGPLPKDKKKAIRKGLKVMCREIQMGVAAAQLGLEHAGIDSEVYSPQRSGMVYGSDYIMTLPEEFESAVRAAVDDSSKFEYQKWAEKSLPKVAPLWLLKYLPNMPASHIAIYNDMRGPNNSLTVREASSFLAIAEAAHTISRGHADVMIAGATGTRIHSIRSVHILLQEEVARSIGDEPACCRPFDLNRNGMILGEGAAVLILEEADAAMARGATIMAELIGSGSGTAFGPGRKADCENAIFRASQRAIKDADIQPETIGHYQAQALGTQDGDRAEAKAMSRIFENHRIPVTATSGFLGNPGAAGGMLQTIAGILALQNQSLYPMINHRIADPNCPILPVLESQPSGDSFLAAGATPQSQAAATLFAAWKE